jgi:hypothetical protein
MPYKFKSRATADLIMLDANGRKLLEIIGKSPDEVHGIITVEQIPAAIAALEAAAAEEAVAGSRKTTHRTRMQRLPARTAWPWANASCLCRHAQAQCCRRQGSDPVSPVASWPPQQKSLLMQAFCFDASPYQSA